MKNKFAFIFLFGRLIGNSSLFRNIFSRHFSNEDKLNIGCGSNFVENWINISLFRFHRIPYFIYLTKKEKKDVIVIHFDITKNLPIKPDSISYVYASHFIEHLNFEQGLKFVNNCYTIMKKGGTIRLSCPDLGLWIQKYFEKDNDFFYTYYNLTKDNNKLSELKTMGEIFMSQLHGWGHKWGYDFESIKDILERAGFTKVVKKEVFDSKIPDIKKLEPTGGTRLLETVYVDATK